MTGMKITLSSAMRARDVSRPQPEDLAAAAEADAAASSAGRGGGAAGRSGGASGPRGGMGGGMGGGTGSRPRHRLPQGRI
jgi:hypothetical protein